MMTRYDDWRAFVGGREIGAVHHMGCARNNFTETLRRTLQSSGSRVHWAYCYLRYMGLGRFRAMLNAYRFGKYGMIQEDGVWRIDR